MAELITNPKVQIVTVCDPNKRSTDYIDWSAEGIRNGIRKALGDTTWGEGFNGIPGGRDVGQDFVDKYLFKGQRPQNLKDVHPISTSASCWKRKKILMPVRS